MSCSAFDDHHLPHFPVLTLLRRAAPRGSRAARVLVEIEREVAADEAELSGIDVIRLDLRERGVVELLAERALEVGVLDHDQRCPGVAQGETAGRELVAHLVVQRRRLLAGLHSFQQLPDLPQLVQDVLGLLVRDAVGPSGDTPVNSAVAEIAMIAIRNRLPAII